MESPKDKLSRQQIKTCRLCNRRIFKTQESTRWLKCNFHFNCFCDIDNDLYVILKKEAQEG